MKVELPTPASAVIVTRTACNAAGERVCQEQDSGLILSSLGRGNGGGFK